MEAAAQQYDIAILGGGVAGLWLLNRLRLNGYSVLLVDSQQLGSGQTLACGTGACAVAAAGFVTKRLRPPCVTVHPPGGSLEIEQAPVDGRIFMTGPAEEVFTGEWNLANDPG